MSLDLRETCQPLHPLILRMIIIINLIYHKTYELPVLAKWMKTIIGGDYVVHSLWQSLRDRLRAVECPSEMIDQIGGWTTTGIGHAYGKGHSVEILARWMQKIECY